MRMPTGRARDETGLQVLVQMLVLVLTLITAGMWGRGDMAWHVCVVFGVLLQPGQRCNDLVNEVHAEVASSWGRFVMAIGVVDGRVCAMHRGQTGDV